MANAKTNHGGRRSDQSRRPAMGTFTQLRHVHICLEGVRRWKNKDLVRLFSGGDPVSAEEIREWIDEQLAAGIRVIPIGNRCNNFDDKEGCMGHPAINEN